MALPHAAVGLSAVCDCVFFMVILSYFVNKNQVIRFQVMKVLSVSEESLFQNI